MDVRRARSLAGEPRACWGAIVCTAAALLAIGAPSARASVPPTVTENIDSVVQFYQHEVMAGDGTCDAACVALVDDLKKPPSNVPGA